LNAGNHSYFLKLDYSAAHQGIYERSFPIVEHLRNHGIGCISRIIKAKDGRLSVRYDGAVLGLFDWIEGENVENEKTKIAEYGILGKIYTVPANDLSICRDDFSTAGSDEFFRQLERLKRGTDDASLGVLAIINQYRDRLYHRAERLALFAERCKPDNSHFYITHGDAGGNVIVSENNYIIVDWDDPRLAPPERDAWFCLYWDWAMAVFNETLRVNGINYKLRPERLAYYCYHSFFFYLTEYMDSFFSIGDKEGTFSNVLTGFFNGWIENEIQFADKMPVTHY
jgi:hypothetical protein